MSQDRFDVAVIGGGIVGLATAHRLLGERPGLSLVLCEKEAELGAHQTGHNSGVIHTGLYYRPGSLKARLCVEGRAAMLEFCREHRVPHEVCGKVVVATDPAELPRLDELERRGRLNGLDGLRRIGPDELRELEPAATGIAALHVPGAAIVDYRAVAARLGDAIRAAGGQVRTGARVDAIGSDGGRHRLRLADGSEIVATALVACAGLQSDRIARRATGTAPARIVPFRGEYYELVDARRDLVRGMVYPVPDPRFPFLGVHFTRTIAGGVEAGPNAVLALHREGYGRFRIDLRDAFDTLRYPGFWRLAGRYWRTAAAEAWRSLSKAAFVRALQRLVPAVRAGDLVRGGCGIRAQALDRHGALLDDFAIVTGERSVHVCNAPSPAATASLAIAGEIVRRLGEVGGGAARAVR